MKASLHNWQVKSGFYYIMGKFVDISGQRFGRLIALSGKDRDKFRNALWTCKCDCGKEVKVILQSLKDGKTKSCGCLNQEKMGKNNLIHGKSKTRIYHIWRDMRERCYIPRKIGYHNYGGRGIVVCEQWKGSNDFLNFYNWAMANGYRDDLTIDRIDVNGNYEPSNCRWASQKEQQNNKRNTIYITYKNETKPLVEWSQMFNMNYMTLLRRFRDKWSAERMFETPIKGSRRFLEYNGKRYKCSELAHQYGLRSETLLYRLSKGLKIEEALTKPLLRHKNQNLHNQITVDGHTIDAFLEGVDNA